MDFQGKVAMVTGAAVGIGMATAMKFAQGGADLVLMDMNGEKLEKLKTQLAGTGVRIETYVCDVANEAAVNEAVADAAAKLGKIDILVNNAAIWRCWKPFEEVDAAEWTRLLNVNIMGVVYCTKAVLGGMKDRKWGRIINIASVAGVYGNANMVHYSATKGAVISLTKALAKEVVADGVLVNAVSPGSVSPSENDDVNYVQPSELAFIGRTGSDMENANVICFLASDEASYVSCQNIQVDGCRRKQ